MPISNNISNSTSISRNQSNRTNTNVSRTNASSTTLPLLTRPSFNNTNTNRNQTNSNTGNSNDDNNFVACSCNEPAIMLTVRKDGPNKGKDYFAIGKFIFV